MPCSSNSTSIVAILNSVVIACVLALVTAAPAAAQSYCASLADTLLDTSDNCVNEPWRDRASSGVETFRWKNHDYMIFNRGNELTIYNIDNPANPNHVATSGFDFGTRGDSDYDLLSFDVCDDCRYGVLGHKLVRTVIFDLGTGGTPQIGGSESYEAADSDLGGNVFIKGGQEYLLAALPGMGCAESGLFTLDGTSNLTLLECVEVGGSGVLVRGLQTLTDGGVKYLFAAAQNSAVHIFRADGSGADLSLAYLTSPAGMRGRGYQLSIDTKNLRAASADFGNSVVTIWDLDAPNPGSPQVLYDVPLRASAVSLRAPSSGTLSTLVSLAGGSWDSVRAFTVGATGFELVVPETFWTDGTLSHNNLPGCVFPVDGALSPDGSVAYVSKFGVHQVFDFTDCLEPTPATADLSITPSTVFPGQSVEVRDTSSGRVDEWALWITEDGVLDAGNDVLNTSNPRTIDYTIPQDVAASVSYVAHVKVDSSELQPDRSEWQKTINIDRTPEASFTIVPSAVIVGDTVTLTATAEGIVGSGGYEWYVTDPTGTTGSRTGMTTSVLVDDSGDWDFELRVNYDHQDPADPPNLYQATNTVLNFPVSSVAADFFWTPTNPLHNQEITLDASTSKPSIGLTYEWVVASATHTYAGCSSAGVQCVIPLDSLSPDTVYTVTLTASNGVDSSVKSKDLFVGDGDVQPEITFSPSSPEIGENIVFTIQGVPVDVDSASWDMDGSGCDGADSTPICTPNLFNDCRAQPYSYSSSGTKDVEVTLEIGLNTFFASTTVTVDNSGSCDGGVPAPCSYSLNPSSAEMGSVEREVAFTVNTSSNCKWTASTTTWWIDVVQPSGQFTGSGTVRYRVQENTGPDRFGSITAGGKAYLVQQKAPWAAADFTASRWEPNAGEVVTFVANPVLEIESWDFGGENCQGSSALIDCSFFPAGTCNTMQWSYPMEGVKTVTLVLTDDRTKSKTLTVHPEGECCYADGRPDAEFSMSADDLYTGETLYLTDLSSKTVPAKALSFSWTPPNPDIGQSVVFTMDGTTGAISKATWDFGESGCGGKSAVQECIPDLWNNCTAMDFAFASGGDKTVMVNVEYEGGGTASAGPQIISVSNGGSCDGGGGGCSYSLSATNESFAHTGGTGSFDVTTEAECGWNATTTSGWLSFEPTGGSGPGTIEFTVAANLGTSTRSGTIRVEGKTFRVTQAADAGDTAPSEWRWTITRVENEEGESVDEDVFTSTDPNPSFRFSLPGRYRVSLVAINCFGSSTTNDFVDVLEAPVEDFVVGAAVSSVTGANDTHWESDLRFYNPCGENLDVRIEYQPENVNNTGVELFFREFQLTPDQTRVFAHITDAIPGLGDDPISGSVRIESQSDSGCKVLSVSRTFNDTPDGSLGLFVPALPVKRMGLDFLDLNGLIHNQDYRTNLRLVNYSDEDVWVALTAYDRNGNQVGERRSANVRGQSTKQVNEIAAWLGVDGDLAPFSVRAEIDGLDVQAFGTVVDNLTGDSVLYLSSFHNENKVWLVGVASLSGVNDSQWRTDLWLYNPTDDWLPGQVEFVVGDSPNDVYGFEWPNLGTHRSKQYLDIVSNHLGLEETRGYIVLTGADGGPAPQVAARTFNLDPAGGTYGLNLRAYGGEDLLQPGETGYIAGVSNSSDQGVGFRTNFGVLNTDRNGWTTVRVTMYNLDGSEAAEPYETSVAPGKLRQFDVFKKLGLGATDMTGSLMIEAISGGAVAVYVTEIDNRTQDSIFIPAQRPFMGLAR